MENKFQSGEGLEVLLFLQEKVPAEVVYSDQFLAHLKLQRDDPFSQDVIGYTEVAKRNYLSFFSSDDVFLLFEHPLKDNMVRFVVYGPYWIQDELSKQFGGFCVRRYWIINNETRTFYGYERDKLPEVSEIIDFIESLLHD